MNNIRKLSRHFKEVSFGPNRVLAVKHKAVTLWMVNSVADIVNLD